jgi:hypothetical protein
MLDNNSYNFFSSSVNLKFSIILCLVIINISRFFIKFLCLFNMAFIRLLIKFLSQLLAIAFLLIFAMKNLVFLIFFFK